MIYMIIVSPNFIELNDFKKSYEHSCILSILLEFSWFQKRFSLSFQRVKLWIEFSTWIWYSKIVIELFKIFYWVMSFHEMLRVFKQNLSLRDLLSLRVLRCDAYFHMSYATFESWDELFLWDECLELWVMSTWVWVIITMHCFESFRGIVDIAPTVSLDGIRKDSYIKSIDVH